VPALAARLAPPHQSRDAALTLRRLGPEGAAAIAGALDAADDSFRADLIRCLGQIGPDARATVPKLIPVLIADNAMLTVVGPAVREMGAGGVPELIKALGNEDPQVRRAAAMLLGEFSQATLKRAEPALTGALKDPDGAVRGRSALVLYSKLEARTAGVLVAMQEALNDPALSGPAAEAVADSRPVPAELVPALRHVLTDGSGPARIDAAAALAGVKEEARAAVLMLVDSLKIPALREQATVALGGIQADEGKEAAPLLQEALKKAEDSQIVGYLGMVLANVAGAESVEPLTEALGRVKPAARPRLVLALGLAGPAGRPQLLKLIADADPAVRVAAAESLHGGDPKVIAALTAALKDRSRAVRLQAARTLGMKGPRAKDAAKALADLLSDIDPGVRAEAALALAHMGAESAAASKTLSRLLRFSHIAEEERTRAIHGLGEIGAEAVPYLADEVKGVRPSTAARAAVELYRIGPPAKEAVPALNHLLREREPLPRAEAALALWKIERQPAALAPLLTAALRDPALRPVVPDPRLLSLKAGSFPPPPFPPRAPAPDDAISLRQRLVEALGEMGPAAAGAVDGLRDAATHDNGAVARAAADALRRVTGSTKP
jgi:HEAT repeat protein